MGKRNSEIFEIVYNEDNQPYEKSYTGRYVKTDNGWEKPYITRVIGWDPGKKRDMASLCILDKCHDNIYRIVGIIEWKNMFWPLQYQHIERLSKILEVDVFAFDANGPGNTCEDTFLNLDHDGKPIYPYLSKINMIPVYAHNRQFKLDAYGDIKNLMVKHRFKFPRNFKGLEDQFAALTISNEGKISHPKGTFIDTPSAIMIAASVFLTKRGNVKHKKFRILGH